MLARKLIAAVLLLSASGGEKLTDANTAGC